MRRAGAAALLALAGCGGAAPGNETARPGPASVIIESEDAIDGRRPALTLICGNGIGSFSLALVRPFDGDPSDLTGLIKVDDGDAMRIALVWLGEDRWAPKLDAVAETAITRQMLAGRSVYFSGPERVNERVYRWDLGRVGDGIVALRDRCG